MLRWCLSSTSISSRFTSIVSGRSESTDRSSSSSAIWSIEVGLFRLIFGAAVPPEMKKLTSIGDEKKEDLILFKILIWRLIFSSKHLKMSVYLIQMFKNNVSKKHEIKINSRSRFNKTFIPAWYGSLLIFEQTTHKKCTSSFSVGAAITSPQIETKIKINFPEKKI